MWKTSLNKSATLCPCNHTEQAEKNTYLLQVQLCFEF